jgi:hypothetical protein
VGTIQCYDLMIEGFEKKNEIDSQETAIEDDLLELS